MTKKIFLFIFLSYAIFFILLPPFQNPDEQGHFETVYWTSRGFYPYVSPEFKVFKHPYAEEMNTFFGPTIQHVFEIPEYKNLQNYKFPRYTAQREKSFLPFSNQAYNPPLYYILASLFLTAAKLLSFNILQTFYFTRLASAVFYFASIFLTYKILEKLYGNKNITKGILFLFSLNPLVIQSGIGISPDIAVTFFTTLTFYVALTLKITNKSVILLGLVVGIAMLSKLSAIFLIPSILFYLYLKKATVKTFIQQTCCFLGIIGITQFPWLVFNYIRYHMFAVDAIALGIPPSKIALSPIPFAAIKTLFDFRHTFMHYAGFVGWNESFPFPVIFILFTAIFIILVLIGIYKSVKNGNIFVKFLAVSTLCMFLFSFVLGFERTLYFHPGWGIGGRNILPIFLPMVIFVSEGVSFLLRKKMKDIIFVFYYFAIFYYFYILIFVLIPRYYV